AAPRLPTCATPSAPPASTPSPSWNTSTRFASPAARATCASVGEDRAGLAKWSPAKLTAPPARPPGPPDTASELSQPEVSTFYLLCQYVLPYPLPSVRHAALSPISLLPRRV